MKKFKGSIYTYLGENKYLNLLAFLTDVNSVDDNTILFSNHLREQYIAIIDINAITVNVRDFFK